MTFHDEFVQLFETHFGKLYRFFDRLSGDPELAADVAQGAFARLYHRGAMPDSPQAWLISVAMNLLRNERSTVTRRRNLLAIVGAEAVVAATPPSPFEQVAERESRDRVRAALDRLPERERHLLLLRAEGYSYREMAVALRLTETSVGTLLARAKQTFRETFEGAHDAT